MKKFTLIVIFITLGTIVSQAQIDATYKSANFYGNGVTEYLVYNNQSGGRSSIADNFFYYNSEAPEQIKLITISVEEEVIGSELQLQYTVSFPYDTQEYILIIGGEFEL